MACLETNYLAQLANIDVEDLQYIEQDLSLSDLVSLAFLLFAEERANAEYVLQKLLVISQVDYSHGSNNLLRQYAIINPQNWRAYLVEALTIIGARHVLRKLGFKWEELRQHYLPHIAELSLHIHPLLKALYILCEQLTLTQASRLVLDVNEHCKQPDQHLRFYNYEYLEVFLIDWLTCRIINLGDCRARGADVNVLLTHLKLYELDILRRLLLDTIKSNSTESQNVDGAAAVDDLQIRPVTETQHIPPKDTERYLVRREHAGIVVIINQRDFHEETELEYQVSHKQ